MANPNIRVDVDGNTAKLRRQIDQVAKQPVSINIQAAGGAAQPLGKISGQIQEIDKSLAAANARVIAFAASAGAIYAIQNAVTSLFSTFVNVEKKLADVNVLLNLTDKNLAKFGASLFDIAGSTAQSFDTVAEAATELSRQGLGVEETLKRTEAALILTRLSGLDAAASVSALTSAINSFGSSALDATEVVNKLASVDSAFAVSSADLANALSRVGSSASDAGVSFDELIALVTTAQQVTARGGSVIGNSLKTIFTRLGRGKVQEVLGGLGIEATDQQGNQKSQVQLLKELAGVYDDLSATQKNYVAEQVGGVFQINVLKAALGDLGKQYSIYDQALKTSLGTTDEAVRRNQKLNETLSARGAKALANVQQAGANIAGKLFEPAAKNVLNISEFLTSSVNDADPESIGAKIGSGIISGIGNFIGGPGLALVTAAAIKLFAEFSKYGAEAFKSLLGVNQAAKEQAAVQQSVVRFLQENASIYKSIAGGQTSVAAGAKSYLEVIKQQTLELQKQNAIAAQIAKTTASQIGIQTVGGRSFITQRGAKIKTAAAGYMPSEYDEAVNISNRVGGANPAIDKPVTLKNFSFGGGKKGAITAHTGEWIIPNYGGGDGTAIWNKEMKKKYGLPDGARKISASGYIPNFATEKKSFPGGVISGRQSSMVANANLDTYSPFSFDLVSIGSKSGFENKFNKELANLNSRDPKLADAAAKYFSRNGYSLSQVNQLKQNLLSGGKKVPSLLSNNSNFVNKSLQVSGVKNDVLGKYFERFAANRLGLQLAQSRTARMDLTDKRGNPVAEVKFGKIDKDNLVSKVIDTNYGRKFKQNPPIKDSIKMPNNYKLVVPNAASGFIPNFATSPKQSDEVIDLGDTRTSQALNGKVLSLIYPEISEGFTMAPGAGSYLGKTYKGLIPVAGINKNVIKGELPDLKKNLGDLLVREANQFGQAVGGKNFLNSAKELPNYGAAEGAVGVAFEGGLLTLLQKDLQKTSQNAGIDFRQNRITPKLRSLFHNAPGMYDAKSSPGAVNEVMQKLLNEAKPGAVKQVKSGPNYGKVQALRTKAIESIRAEGLTLRRGPQLEKEIEKRMAALSGAASGYIPNFASPDLIKQISSRITNPNVASKLSEGSGLSNNAYIKAASKLGVNTAGLESFLKQPGFPLRGKEKIAALSRALGTSFGRSFNVDALKLGDWNYVKKSFEENGLTRNDFDQVSKFAKSVRGENAFRWGFKSKAAGFIPNFVDSAILEQIRLKSSYNFKEIKTKPGIEKRINELYKQYPDLQYLGSGAESHAFKSGNKVLKLPTLDYKSAMQQRAKVKEIGSIDWATATRQLKRAEPSLQLMPLRRVSNNSLVTSQRFAGNTFKDEINDYDVENSLISLVESKFNRAKASVSEKPNWLQALGLDTASSANFTFMRPLSKDMQIQAREGIISPQNLLKTNKVGLIDPVIFGHVASRLTSEAQNKVGKKFASGFIPNLAAANEYAKNVLALEESVSGKKAIIGTKPFLHIRNKSQPSFASAIRDHGGKNKAMKDSAEMQKSAGLLAASGFVPNFAIGDRGEDYSSGGTDFAAISAAISSLLFSLAFFGGQLDEGAKELRSLKTELKSTGKSLDETFESNQKRISKQNRALEKINAREESIRSNSSWFNKQTGMYTPEGEAQIGRVEKLKGRVEQGLAKSEARQQAIMTARSRAKEGIGAKIGRFGQEKGMAFGFAGQALGGVASQIFGGENTTGGALSTAFGNIAGFAGTGAMIGKGPWGMVIGGLVGAAVSAKPVLDALTTSVNEFSKTAAEARQSAQRAGESSQQISTSRQTYEELLKNPNVDIKKVAKAESAYLSALGKLPAAYLEQYMAAKDLTEAQEVLTKYMMDQAENADLSELILDLESGLNTWFNTLTKSQGKSLAQRLMNTYDIGGSLKNPQEKVDLLGKLEDVVNKAIDDTERAMQDNEDSWFFSASDVNGKDILANVTKSFRDQINENTPEGKAQLEKVKELENELSKQSPNLQNINILLEELRKLLKGEKDSYQKIIEAEKKRAAIVAAMPAEQQALLKAIQENRKKLEDQADIFGNLNKILNISIPKFNLDLARQTDTAIMQYRSPSFGEETALSAARINQESALKRVEIGADVLDSFRSGVQEQLSSVLDQALSKQGSGDLAKIAPQLQGLNEQLRTATSFEQIKNLDISSILDQAGPNLKQAWEDSMDIANKKFKMAMDQLRFETEAAKVKEAFDIAVKRFNERIQKMQGYAGGISGLMGFDPTQMEDNQLRAQYRMGEIGPLKYRREMAKFERQQTLMQLEAVDALGLPEQYKKPIRDKLIAKLQEQSDVYLDAIGLSNLKGIGRLNVEDMVKQQYGGMAPGDKFANPYNQAAEDLVKAIGYLGVDIQKYSKESLDGLQKEADNAAEKLLNLANCAQTLTGVLCPLSPTSPFAVKPAGGSGASGAAAVTANTISNMGAGTPQFANAVSSAIQTSLQQAGFSGTANIATPQFNTAISNAIQSAMQQSGGAAPSQQAIINNVQKALQQASINGASSPEFANAVSAGIQEVLKTNNQKQQTSNNQQTGFLGVANNIASYMTALVKVQEAALKKQEETKKSVDKYPAEIQKLRQDALNFNQGIPVPSNYQQKPFEMPKMPAKEFEQNYREILDLFKKVISVNVSGPAAEEPTILPSTFQEALDALLSQGQVTPSQQEVLLPELARLAATSSEGNALLSQILSALPKNGQDNMPYFGIGGAKEQGYMGEPPPLVMGKYTQDFMTVLKSLAYPSSPLGTTKTKLDVITKHLGVATPENMDPIKTNRKPNLLARTLLEDTYNANKDLRLSYEEMIPYAKPLEDLGDQLLGKKPIGKIISSPKSNQPQKPLLPYPFNQAPTLETPTKFTPGGWIKPPSPGFGGAWNTTPREYQSPFFTQPLGNITNIPTSLQPSVPFQAGYNANMRPMELFPKATPNNQNFAIPTTGPAPFFSPPVTPTFTSPNQGLTPFQAETPFPKIPLSYNPNSLGGGKQAPEGIQVPKPSPSVPVNIDNGKKGMEELKNQLDKNKASVDKNTSSSDENTQVIKEAPQTQPPAEQRQLPQGEQPQGKAPDIKFQTDLSNDFSINVSLAQDAITEMNGKIQEMQSQFKTELTTAIDEVKRMIANMKTKGGQGTMP